MTPTNEVRGRLNELGIKYTTDDSNDYEIVEWQGPYNLWWQFVYDPYDEEPYGELRLRETGGATHLTPEQAIAATVGARDYTYDEWRAINEAVGDAMEYAHEHAVMYPDKADPLWNIDEYVNRVLEVAYGPKDAATVGAGTCDGSFHKPSDLSSGRVPLYYCKDTNRSIFVEREAKVCPLCGGRIKEKAE